MFVKVVRMPGAVTEVAIEEDATVADALSAAGITLGSTEKVTVNGEAVSLNDVVDDGDRVIVAKEAKSA